MTCCSDQCGGLCRRTEPHGLWVDAADALIDIPPGSPPDGRAARFSVPAPDGAPQGVFNLTVAGYRQPVTDFIRSGAIRFDTFEIVADHTMTTDDITYRLLLGRNAGGTIATYEILDQPSDGEDNTSAPDQGAGPGRNFDVSVDVDDSSFALWSVRASLTESETPAAAQVRMALQKASGNVGLECDGWSASKKFKIIVDTYKSGVTWRGGSAWYGQGWVSTGLTSLTVCRAAGSAASRVYYEMSS